MRYRKLGRTDLDVSVLGFGASPLSSVFSVTDPAKGLRAVYRAIDCGINFFDVSPDYGATLAKMRLGEALAGRRDAVIVATKCGRCGAAECDFSAERVTREVNHSLERLQTEYVDLLQVHDVEFGSVHQIVYETLSALRVLQHAGKVRYIGITGFSLKTLAAILERAEADTVLSYCRYKLMVDDMDAALTPLVRARRIGLINASTLHMGILSPSAAACLAPCAGGGAGGCCAQSVCVAHGCDLTELAALRFCPAHAYVSSTLVGISSVKELKQNLRAVEMENDAAVLAGIAEATGGDHNYVWKSEGRKNHD